MARHRGAVSGIKPFTALLAAALMLTALTGCVTYIPREDRTEEITATEEITTQPDTTATEQETTAPLNTTFPNEPEDGHTKRY